MPVINVLYLPRDDRLRSLVRLALDFVEDVYKDESLANLKLVSFDRGDSVDVEQAKRIIVREKFTTMFGHGVRELERLVSFNVPHYSSAEGYVWIPVSKHHTAQRIFDVIAHEVTHHVLFNLPIEDKESLYRAFYKDIRIDEVMAGRKVRLTIDLAMLMGKEIVTFVHELATVYTVDNYFIYLQRVATTPTTNTRIGFIAINRYSNILANPPRSRELAEILSIIYIRAAYDDLARFRNEVHRVFSEVVKKLPADVLESNRAKYGILYGR
jgi:hypothetical protein